LGSALVVMLLSGCVPPAAVPASAPPESVGQVNAEQIMKTVLDDQWSQVGLPDDQRPDVPRERVIEMHEWPTRIPSCLNEYFRSTLTPCLTGLGFDVEEPPSLDTFIEENGPSSWSPFMNLGEGLKVIEAQEKCPAMPEGLYGDAPE